MFGAGFQPWEKWLFGKQKPPLSGRESLKKGVGICRKEPCLEVTGDCEARHGGQKLAVMILGKVHPIRAGL